MSRNDPRSAEAPARTRRRASTSHSAEGQADPSGPGARRALPASPRHRGVFCNRTLNLRAVRAIGYDMDYTLIHYRIAEWESRAYEHLRQRLTERIPQVQGLTFDPDFTIRGLIIDTERGNLLKVNRFGYVKRALHGYRTGSMDLESQREIYGREIVSLGNPRYVFLNTLFSVSEASMYAQLVDILDDEGIPGITTYAALYRLMRGQLNAAHVEGALKDEIIADPERFVELDPDLPQTLWDQREAGKRLMLITNSEWAYTSAMMAYAVDRYLPRGVTWRDLFEVIVVSARKPEFFTEDAPWYQIVSEDGLLRPVLQPHAGGLFVGGSALGIERYLGLTGSDILYVGDHIYTDVNISRRLRQWRTALVVRELEDELFATESFRGPNQRLTELMAEKEALEQRVSTLRLELLRLSHHSGPTSGAQAGTLEAELGTLRAELRRLDDQIGPLASAASELLNPRWGLLMRAGNDKSHLARQVERYADIYMSRVSNLMYITPFAFLRSARGSLPHDV